MDSKPSKHTNFQNIEEYDRIRTQIVLGLIAIYSGFSFVIKSIASSDGNPLNIYLAFAFYGFYAVSMILFFIYLILTALHYKYTRQNFAEEYYFPEKFRHAVYDTAINWMVIGFVLYSPVYAGISSAQKYLNFSGVVEILIGLVLGSIPVLIWILFHFFFIEKKFR